MKLNKTSLLSIAFLAAAIAFVWLGPGSIAAQDNQRQITVEPVPKKAGPLPIPVEIVQLESRGVAFRAGEPITAEDDWLNGLRITIKNTSTRPILHVKLQFCRQNPEDPRPHHYNFCVVAAMYGEGPRPSRAFTPTMRLAPGEEASATVEGDFYEGLVAMYAKRGQTKLNHMLLVVDQVVFDDMTAWHKGFLHRQLPGAPGAWGVIGREKQMLKALTQKRAKIGRNSAGPRRGTAAGFPASFSLTATADLFAKPFAAAPVVYECGDYAGWTQHVCPINPLCIFDEEWVCTSCPGIDKLERTQETLCYDHPWGYCCSPPISCEVPQNIAQFGEC